MATVSLASTQTTKHPSAASNVKMPYLVEATLDFATAATTKGSALAASDVIEVLRIPAESVVIFAGFEVTTAVSGASSDVTITLGDGGDPNRWVDTFDLDAAAAGAYGTLVIATTNPTAFASSDTVDVVITAATTAPTAGKLRVFAQIVDVSDAKKPGLAALKS